eukprot:323165_1
MIEIIHKYPIWETTQSWKLIQSAFEKEGLRIHKSRKDTDVWFETALTIQKECTTRVVNPHFDEKDETYELANISLMNMCQLSPLVRSETAMTVEEDIEFDDLMAGIDERKEDMTAVEQQFYKFLKLSRMNKYFDAFKQIEFCDMDYIEYFDDATLKKK